MLYLSSFYTLIVIVSINTILYHMSYIHFF